VTPPRRPLVLMYHGVGSRPTAGDPYNLFVPATALRAQLRWLLDQGWRPLRLAEYLAQVGGPARAGRQFLVTFDDGYRSVHDVALPLLAELRVPATVFLCAGLLGGRSGWMPELPDEPLVTRAEAIALRAGGLDIGLHGMDHTVLAGLSPAELRRQIDLAADRLAAELGERPAAFAYPCGVHDRRARAAVAAAGMRVAFATYRGGGRFAVPRVDVNATDNGRTFRLKTRRGYPWLRRLSGAVPGLRPTLHGLLGGPGTTAPAQPAPAQPAPAQPAPTQPTQLGRTSPARRGDEPTDRAAGRLLGRFADRHRR
jgi:peptidoglycan/xylan/chitin deacetylase (PgdA/CDA1 family)